MVSLKKTKSIKIQKNNNSEVLNNETIITTPVVNTDVPDVVNTDVPDVVNTDVPDVVNTDVPDVVNTDKTIIKVKKPRISKKKTDIIDNKESIEDIQNALVDKKTINETKKVVKKTVKKSVKKLKLNVNDIAVNESSDVKLDDSSDVKTDDSGNMNKDKLTICDSIKTDNLDLELRTRSFKVQLPDETEFRGRFTGLTPYQAANKALSKYFRNNENTNLDTGYVLFSISESTRGSKRSIYTYKGTRIKLEKAITYSIKSSTGEDRIITKQYKNQLVKVKKNTIKPIIDISVA